MDELSKVVRVMRKQDERVPHETLLVLDAGTGQNAVSQAIEFDQAVGVTGVAVTKLDGTARGGGVYLPSRINSIARSGMSEWASNQMISVILSRGILSVRF